jgi:MFS family permease
VFVLPRHRLGPTAAFAAATGVLGLAAFASATPSPLYADYAARWHFTTVVLTSVYAIYAIGVLASLLLAGRLSDEIGRRPVLAASLVGLLGSLALFICASSLAWLLAARALQGLATGPILSAGAAALLDLEPRRDTARAGLVNGVSAGVGIGSGAFVSALVVQALPAPRVTPYVVLAGLTLAALVSLALLPEPVTRRGSPRLQPQRPYVPAEIRGAFALAAAATVAACSVGGLYLALAPALAVDLLRTHSHLAGGVSVLLLGAGSGAAQIACRRLTASSATQAGSLTLAVGMAAIAASISAASAVVFLAGSTVTGAGFGLAFMGAVRSTSVAAPAAHRAGVMSAFYVVMYLALSVPAVVAGLVEPGMGIESTFRAFAAAVVALALVTAVKSRPPAIRSSHDACPATE